MGDLTFAIAVILLVHFVDLEPILKVLFLISALIYLVLRIIVFIRNEFFWKVKDRKK